LGRIWPRAQLAFAGSLGKQCHAGLASYGPRSLARLARGLLIHWAGLVTTPAEHAAWRSRRQLDGVQKLMWSSWRGPEGCNGQAGQGPMDGGATKQWGDERADELPGGSAAPAWIGVEAADDGSYEHEGAMRMFVTQRWRRKRDRCPRSPRSGDCGGTTTVGAVAGGQGRDWQVR
jgi:hypothetical protein